MELSTIEFTKDQEALIKAQIAPTLNSNELLLFLHVAKRAGLDPLARQIYAIKRGNQMTIQTAIDGFRAIADRTGQHVSTSDAVFVEENGHILKATITVQKMAKNGVIGDFTASAYYKEYEAQGPLWKKMPHTMIAKCAEALALRKAFSAQLTGLYTNDEMKQADNQEDNNNGNLATAPIKVINPNNTLKNKMEAKLNDVNKIANIIDNISASIFNEIADEHKEGVPNFMRIISDANRTVDDMQKLRTFCKYYDHAEKPSQYANDNFHTWELTSAETNTVREHITFLKSLFDNIPFDNDSTAFESEVRI
jgi:phage recombination protein Bet